MVSYSLHLPTIRFPEIVLQTRDVHKLQEYAKAEICPVLFDAFYLHPNIGLLIAMKVALLLVCI